MGSVVYIKITRQTATQGTFCHAQNGADWRRTTKMCDRCALFISARVARRRCTALLVHSKTDVEGKSSVYVICMKYRIIILIIIIISVGQLVLSYIANTPHTHTRALTHARAHTHTPPSPFRLSLFDGSLAPNRDAVNAPQTGRWRSMAGRWFTQINTRAGEPVSASLWVFFACKKIARPN